MKHPIQPLATDQQGTLRFKKNAIVSFLAEGRLNELATVDFPQEDHEQLAQLIGYSLDGFGSLSYVRNETYETARLMSEGAPARVAEVEALEAEIERLREIIRVICDAVSEEQSSV
jgi:hypothetical protein